MYKLYQILNNELVFVTENVSLEEIELIASGDYQIEKQTEGGCIVVKTVTMPVEEVGE